MINPNTLWDSEANAPSALALELMNYPWRPARELFPGWKNASGKLLDFVCDIGPFTLLDTNDFTKTGMEFYGLHEAKEHNDRRSPWRLIPREHRLSMVEWILYATIIHSTSLSSASRTKLTNHQIDAKLIRDLKKAIYFEEYENDPECFNVALMVALGINGARYSAVLDNFFHMGAVFYT